MGQRGFWDEQQRVTKLQDKKPVLKRLLILSPGNHSARIKQWGSLRQFKLRGTEKVGAVLSLHVIAYT